MFNADSVSEVVFVTDKVFHAWIHIENKTFQAQLIKICIHKKLNYVYPVQTFLFVKKSYFGGHLGCQF